MRRTWIVLACAVLALGFSVTRAEDGAKEKAAEQPQKAARPAQRAGPGQPPRMVLGVQGKLTKVEANSITFVPDPPPAVRRRKEAAAKDGKAKNVEPKGEGPKDEGREHDEPAPEEQTLAVDEKTLVFIGVGTSERTLPNGRKTKSIRFARTDRSDLKPGQQVLVRSTGGHADHVSIMPQEAPANDGL
jgi:hypothetical protein